MVVLKMHGHTLMDRRALAQWTGRSVETIRRYCVIVGRDDKGRALYNAHESWKLLQQVTVRERGKGSDTPKYAA